MSISATLVLSLAAAVFCQAPAPGAVTPQPPSPAAHTDPMLSEPLQQDPRLVSGTLPNGLRYHILRHANPPERISMWMHVRVGSLQESDEERGIAHYLEHLAFCGSEHFPPGTVVSAFSRSASPSGHQNASTGFEQTNYQIALPDNSPRVRQALLFFSDVWAASPSTRRGRA